MELTRNIKLENKNIDTIIFSITEVINMVSHAGLPIIEDEVMILDELKNALYLSLMEKGREMYLPDNNK